MHKGYVLVVMRKAGTLDMVLCLRLGHATCYDLSSMLTSFTGSDGTYVMSECALTGRRGHVCCLYSVCSD